MTRADPPVPRAGVYELYWQFAARRQAVFERRVAGDPPPWTGDPILRRFKFCNDLLTGLRVAASACWAPWTGAGE